MDTSIYFLFFCAVFIFCVRGQSLGENHLSWLTEDEILQSKDELPGCDMKNDIADLKDLMVSVKEELNEMKTGFIKEVNDKLPVCDRKNDIADLKDLMVSIRKELNEMKTEFMEEIKAMWNNTKEEKPSKKVSTNPAKNKCADALYFRGGNTFEYAKSVSRRPGLVADERSSSSSGAPEEGLNAMTSCFWIKTLKRSDAPNVLSYAIPERDNEITIYLLPNVTLLLKTKAGTSFYPQDLGIWVSDGKWHHVCITWENIHGTLQAYKDGVLRNSRTGFKPGAPIAPHGMWIIGQDQDRYGGGFQLNNAFHGSLTQVNVWNRVLDASEISTLAKQCGTGMAGNYRAYSDFVPYGGIQKITPSCCEQ
ncbi:Hypothetical predicted protein [Paramuricea clavata]|uniref:Pentraxin (PTX) domain-containing protein n=1 Tax=Paramuricea clavata TaxID=317549 RepID=A0A6S7HK28_PARCT|nr:Hypothetical predicted protein [Paramuricea clavata]